MSRAQFTCQGEVFVWWKAFSVSVVCLWSLLQPEASYQLVMASVFNICHNKRTKGPLEKNDRWQLKLVR